MTGQKKSRTTAIAAFALGLTFWIPLLNLIFGAFAIYFGRKALLNIKKEPNKYGGKVFAIIGLVLGLIVYLFYIMGIGMCLIGYREICKNLGLAFLA